MTAASMVRLSFPEPDIALLTLDAQGKRANVLSQAVLQELSACLDDIEKRPDIAGVVVISGKPGTFIVGADINEFAAAKDLTEQVTYDMCTRGRTLFQRLCKIPGCSVAAMDGICVGGGAELAIWCDRRLMSQDAKTAFGFPEVKLGLIPGWGGTARTPRIIGLANAVELVTGGEPIGPDKAVQLGLVTDAVPADSLFKEAVRLIRMEQKSKSYEKDRARWAKSIDMSEIELGYLGATASAYIQQQTKGQYPAPNAALEVMLEGSMLSTDDACDKEAHAMAGLFGTPINRALIQVFQLQDKAKKDPGVLGPVEAKPIKSLGVFGAGIMGRGIAAASLRRDLAVTMTDAVPAALKAGVPLVLEEAAFDRAAKGASLAKAMSCAGNLNPAYALEEFQACDLIIEAIVENFDAKRALFATLEPQLGPDKILATNTSTIPIAKLAQGMRHPERFCGIHFFNPVRKMPLVEVIRGPATNDQTVAAAVAYAKAIGKTPIVVQDGPGFLVNRLLLPYMNEALELLLEGAEIKQVDRASRHFGMPMGPITLYDVVGLDTALFAGKVMQDAFGDRSPNSALLEAMVAAGRLGQKTGVGFFAYKDKQLKGTPDPSLENILGPLRRGKHSFTDQEIQDRLFLPMLVEASRVLDEKIVRTPRDLDLGLIYGCGFPPFKGGLLWWADTVGLAHLLERLKPLSHLGAKFVPTDSLVQMAKSGQAFHPMT